jgi:hypothetical protein
VNKELIYKYRYVIGGALALAIAGFVVYKSRNTKKEEPIKDQPASQGTISNGKSIAIGDSQTPFIAKQSKKVKMLGNVGGESVLWKGGMGLRWLKDATSNYPISKDVSNVVISIGTNGGFNSKDDVAGLVSQLKRVFPNSQLYVVKGSWGWGGNKSITESKVNAYYQKFKNEGVNVITKAIGSVKDPHGNLPIYKEIGKEIDETIK